MTPRFQVELRQMEILCNGNECNTCVQKVTTRVQYLCAKVTARVSTTITSRLVPAGLARGGGGDAGRLRHEQRAHAARPPHPHERRLGRHVPGCGRTLQPARRQSRRASGFREVRQQLHTRIATVAADSTTLC